MLLMGPRTAVAFSMYFLTKFHTQIISRPTLSLVFLLLLMYLQKSLIPFVSLTRFESRWVLAFLSPHFNNVLLQPLPCFIFMSEFCQELLIHQEGLLLSFSWLPDGQGGPLLSWRRWSSVHNLVFSSVSYHGTLWPYIGQSRFSWSPGLESCFLPCPLLSRFQTPSIQGSWSLGCLQSSHMHLVLPWWKCSRSCPLVGSSILCVKELSSAQLQKPSRLLVPCSAASQATREMECFLVDLQMSKIQRRARKLLSGKIIWINMKYLWSMFFVDRNIATCQYMLIQDNICRFYTHVYVFRIWMGFLLQ